MSYERCPVCQGKGAEQPCMGCGKTTAEVQAASTIEDQVRKSIASLEHAAAEGRGEMSGARPLRDIPMMESVDQRLERLERRVADLEDFAIAYQQHSHAWTPPPTYGPLPTPPRAEWNISALTKFIQEGDQTDEG